MITFRCDGFSQESCENGFSLANTICPNSILPLIFLFAETKCNTPFKSHVLLEQEKNFMFSRKKSPNTGNDREILFYIKLENDMYDKKKILIV